MLLLPTPRGDDALESFVGLTGSGNGASAVDAEVTRRFFPVDAEVVGKDAPLLLPLPAGGVSVRLSGVLLGGGV